MNPSLGSLESSVEDLDSRTFLLIEAKMHHWALINNIPLGYDTAISFCKKQLYYLEIYNCKAHSGAWRKVHLWCKDCFGDDNYSWAGDTFVFKTDEDRLMFKLRWG